jgi:hypothetical protein
MHAKDTHTWLASVNRSHTIVPRMAGIRDEQLQLVHE